MASGVGVGDECMQAFRRLKSKREHKFIIFHLVGDKEIDVELTSSSLDYEEFVRCLPEDKCRWAVYDLEYENKEGGKRNKIAFFAWSPDKSSIKEKMKYASSKDALRRKLDGVAFEIQGTDLDEIDHGKVLEKAGGREK